MNNACNPNAQYMDVQPGKILMIQITNDSIMTKSDLCGLMGILYIQMNQIHI